MWVTFTEWNHLGNHSNLCQKGTIKDSSKFLAADLTSNKFLERKLRFNIYSVQTKHAQVVHFRTRRVWSFFFQIHILFFIIFKKERRRKEDFIVIVWKRVLWLVLCSIFFIVYFLWIVIFCRIFLKIYLHVNSRFKFICLIKGFLVDILRETEIWDVVTFTIRVITECQIHNFVSALLHKRSRGEIGSTDRAKFKKI